MYHTSAAGRHKEEGLFLADNVAFGCRSIAAHVADGIAVSTLDSATLCHSPRLLCSSVMRKWCETMIGRIAW